VVPVAWIFGTPPTATLSVPGRRTVTAMSSLPHRRREIALSAVGHDRHDKALVFPGDLRRGCDRTAAGWPAEDPFLAREAFRHRDRLVRPDRVVFVGDPLIPERGTDRRGHVLPAFDPVEGRIGLHRDDPHALR